MRKIVADNNIYRWGAAILSRLVEIAEGAVKHLFRVWDAFRTAFAPASHVLLLADYDGTLTPIVGRPADALLSESVRRVLKELAQKPTFSVGVISGRSLAELKSLVGIEGIYYAGNHGLEMEGPGLEYTGPASSNFIGVAMAEMAEKMAAALADVAGVIIQNKGLSVSVHYRLAAEDKEGLIADAVKRLTAPWVAAGKLRVYSMKKLWEIRPLAGGDKGQAVQAIEQEIRKN